MMNAKSISLYDDILLGFLNIDFHRAKALTYPFALVAPSASACALFDKEPDATAAPLFDSLP